MKEKITNLFKTVEENEDLKKSCKFELESNQSQQFKTTK